MSAIEPSDIGWYVDVIGEHCPRCGDVDQTATGKCLTCSAGVAAPKAGFTITDNRRVSAENCGPPVKSCTPEQLTSE